MADGKEGFHNNEHIKQNHCKEGKLKPEIPAAQPPKCPQCNSQKLWRDGLRYKNNEQPIQRWLCRDCALRFSNPYRSLSERSEHVSTLHTKSSYTHRALPFHRLVCVTEAEGTKNLAEETTVKSEAEARQPTTITNTTIKGKIIEYSFHLQKQGYAPETI